MKKKISIYARHQLLKLELAEQMKVKQCAKQAQASMVQVLHDQTPSIAPAIVQWGSYARLEGKGSGPARLAWHSEITSGCGVVPHSSPIPARSGWRARLAVGLALCSHLACQLAKAALNLLHKKSNAPCNTNIPIKR